MTSDRGAGRPRQVRAGEAYVWVWLPGAVDPVVAGVLERDHDRLVFQYGQSYLERSEAIPLYLPELPLTGEAVDPPRGMRVAGSLRDAAPDAWGQQIILARLAAAGRDLNDDLLTFMLESGSDRIGGVDFQGSPSEYVPRDPPAELDELLEAATRFAEGEALNEALSRALLHGTSIGGARPKVLLVAAQPDPNGGVIPQHVIAKFSLSQDPYPVVKAEAVAMNLARRVGLDVASSEVVARAGRDVLLVDRFDRPGSIGSAPGTPGERRLMVSALTILGLSEDYGRHATYAALADSIRKRFTSPRSALRELFARLVFSILVSNTDDHARNHSAFWDGAALTLTPAYDISPQLRPGETGAQAMAIARDGARASKVAVAVRAAQDVFAIRRDEALQIIDEQVEVIRSQWADAADECLLTRADRQLMWERLILNPGVFQDEDPDFDTYGS